MPLGSFAVGGSASIDRLATVGCGGIYVAANPTAGFFYVFTGAHGLHLAGGIAALVLVESGRRDG